jgi:hypothetical protein
MLVPLVYFLSQFPSFSPNLFAPLLNSVAGGILLLKFGVPVLVQNFNNETNDNTNNSFAVVNTRFEGLSQVCCIPPDIQLAIGSKHVMETVNSEAAIYTKAGSLIKKFGLVQLIKLLFEKHRYKL